MLEELQSIVDSLATRLQRSVAIDDPRMRVLVYTPHHGERVDRYRVESIMQKLASAESTDWYRRHGIETATGPMRIPADPLAGFAARICVPVRYQGRLHGYLWLLDQGAPVTDVELAEAAEAADAAARVLYQELLLGDLRRARQRELLRDLVASDESVRAEAARQLVAGDGIGEDAKIVVVAVRVGGADLDPAEVDVALDVALRHAATRLAPAQALWITRAGAGAMLLIAARQPPRAERVAEIAAGLRGEVLDQLGGRARVRVGVGPVVDTVAAAHHSHRRALDTLRVAAEVPGFDDVVGWDSLGIYRLLVRLPRDLIRDGVPDGLRRLVDGDDSGVLAETLEVYLDEAAAAPATVERLAIHRTSLYYRLRRIQEITGMRLDNGADRLALHLGVKLIRLDGDRL